MSFSLTFDDLVNIGRRRNLFSVLISLFFCFFLEVFFLVEVFFFGWVFSFFELVDLDFFFFGLVFVFIVVREFEIIF